MSPTAGMVTRVGRWPVVNQDERVTRTRHGIDGFLLVLRRGISGLGIRGRRGRSPVWMIRTSDYEVETLPSALHVGLGDLHELVASLDVAACPSPVGIGEECPGHELVTHPLLGLLADLLPQQLLVSAHQVVPVVRTFGEALPQLVRKLEVAHDGQP